MGKHVQDVNDPAIPTLIAALHPASLAQHLSGALVQEKWGAIEEIKLKVLKWHRASRCTFEIALKTPRGWQEMIGKVYAENRSDIYPTMEKIRMAGFAGQEFAIARPLAYIESLRLLLYEKVPGTQARKLIVHAAERERVAAVERCARWLARFQSKAGCAGAAFCIDDYLTSWEQWASTLGALGARITPKVRLLLTELRANALGRNVPMCAGHGMYTCGQVLFDNGRTVTIDWDTFNLTDPAHDVARFLVDLKRMAMKYFGSLHALDWAAEVFLTTYVRELGVDVPAHLEFHEASLCMERAKSDVEKQLAGWQERAEMMLDEGISILSRRPH